MLARILPVLFVALLPLDLIAGLSRGMFPTEATLSALAGLGLGIYLARRLWNGGFERLDRQARLQVVSQQGPAFDPQSEEAQVRLDNARVNHALGAGLMLFSFALTLLFIISYLVSRQVAGPVSLAGQLVQLAVMVLFNLIAIAIGLFGARVFLKR